MAVFKRIQRLEAQLGEFQQRVNEKVETDLQGGLQQQSFPMERIAALENALDLFSTKSKENLFRRPNRLAGLISKFRNDFIVFGESASISDIHTTHFLDLSWLVAAKASLQTLAIVLRTLSGNVLSLGDEIRYWEDVLDSTWYTGFYGLQSSPFKLWHGLMKTDIFEPFKNTPEYAQYALETRSNQMTPVTSRWRGFYQLVQRCLYQQKSSFFRAMPSPLARTRFEVQRKRRSLITMKNFNASAIGLLLENCLSPGIDNRNSPGFTSESLHCAVSRTVKLMKTLLESSGRDDMLSVLNDDLFSGVDEKIMDEIHFDDYYSPEKLGLIIDQLMYILEELLPNYQTISSNATHEFGRPPALVRYWLPLAVGIVSASMSLNLLRDRSSAVVSWIENFGSTSVEFWRNWVVGPSWKLMRTIRHDETSEIALMSRNSLEADRASLERMVVDFVLDRGDPKSTTTLSTSTIASKVREGDLTPVLRAYEKDLRSPFVGTVRGDLVRALLIQIQKTKVDVEIAISGIDALLKSQELVFGFVGLTPGILVSYASIRWFYGLLGSRKGFQIGRQQDDMRYALRNIHRTLISTAPTMNGLLSYKNHGLLICNIEILIRKAETVMKGEDLLAFQEDIADLINENHVDRQLRIVERMTWTYSKWT